MSLDESSNESPASTFDAAIAECYRRIDNGEDPALVREEILAQFPVHANDLLARFKRDDDFGDFLARYQRAASFEDKAAVLRTHPSFVEELAAHLEDEGDLFGDAAKTGEYTSVAGEPPENSLALGGVVREGDEVDSYKVGSFVAQGGMGVVYRGFDSNKNCAVALKFLQDTPQRQQDDLIRFRLEGDIAANIVHPNVVRVYGFGNYRGHPYIAMEWVEGGALKVERGKQRGDRQEVIRRVESIARALVVIHASGVIHRDLKPSNILVAADGTWKVSDFGLAKRMAFGTTQLTVSRALVGTPKYTSPEQLRGDVAGPQADIYSLGLILYELLSGDFPFDGSEHRQIFARLEEEPIRLRRKVRTAPRDLEAVCTKALERDLNLRYATMVEFADDLKGVLDKRPILARPLGSRERFAKLVSRHRWIAGLSAALFFAVTAGFVFSLWQWSVAKSNSIEAQQNFADAFEKVDTYYRLVSDDPRLQHAGNEELRRELLAKAEHYYEEFNRQHSNDPRCEFQWAIASWRLGWVESNSTTSGAMERGTERVQRALAVLERFAAKNPETFELRRAEVGCRAQLASLISQAGKPEQASEMHRQCGKAFEELLRIQPDDVTLRRSYAGELHNAGILFRRLGELDAARDYFERERTITERLADQIPDNPFERFGHGICLQALASIHQDIARKTRSAQEWASATDWHQRAVNYIESLERDFPRNSEFRSGLAKAQNGLGGCLWEQNKQGAEEWFDKSTANWRRIVEENPRNRVFRTGLTENLANRALLSSVRIASGQDSTAIETLWREVIRLNEELVRDHPTVTAFQVDLARNHVHFANMYRRLGRFGEGEVCYTSALGILQKLPESIDAADQANRYRSEASEGRGICYLSLKRAVAAVTDFENAIAIPNLYSRNNLPLLRSYALAVSGDYARAAEAASQLRLEKATDFYTCGSLYALCAAAAARDRIAEKAPRDLANRYADSAIANFREARRRRMDLEKRLATDADLEYLRHTPPYSDQLQELSRPAQHIGLGQSKL